jgi:hypothetical protein
MTSALNSGGHDQVPDQVSISDGAPSPSATDKNVDRLTGRVQPLDTSGGHHDKGSGRSPSRGPEAGSVRFRLPRRMIVVTLRRRGTLRARSAQPVDGRCDGVGGEPAPGVSAHRGPTVNGGEQDVPLVQPARAVADFVRRWGPTGPGGEDRGTRARQN